MALQNIDIGLLANDGTGDDLRTAFEKVNFNFIDLDDRIDASTIGENIGGAIEIYAGKVDNALQLRTLEGDNISLSVSGNKIVVAFSPDSEVDFNLQNVTNVGDLTVRGSMYLPGVDSKLVGNVQGNLAGNVAGVVYAPIGSFGLQGNVVGRNPSVGEDDPFYEPALVDGVSILDLNRTVTNFDFGSIANRTYSNPITYLLGQIGLDMGTMADPAGFDVDTGSFL